MPFCSSRAGTRGEMAAEKVKFGEKGGEGGGVEWGMDKRILGGGLRV